MLSYFPQCPHAISPLSLPSMLYPLPRCPPCYIPSLTAPPDNISPPPLPPCYLSPNTPHRASSLKPSQRPTPRNSIHMRVCRFCFSWNSCKKRGCALYARITVRPVNGQMGFGFNCRRTRLYTTGKAPPLSTFQPIHPPPTLLLSIRSHAASPGVLQELKTIPCKLAEKWE